MGPGAVVGGEGWQQGGMGAGWWSEVARKRRGREDGRAAAEDGDCRRKGGRWLESKEEGGNGGDWVVGMARGGRCWDRVAGQDKCVSSATGLTDASMSTIWTATVWPAAGGTVQLPGSYPQVR